MSVRGAAFLGIGSTVGAGIFAVLGAFVAVLAITVLAIVFEFAWGRDTPPAQPIPGQPATAGAGADLRPHT